MFLWTRFMVCQCFWDIWESENIWYFCQMKQLAKLLLINFLPINLLTNGAKFATDLSEWNKAMCCLVFAVFCCGSVVSNPKMLKLVVASRSNPWCYANTSKVNSFLLSFSIPTQYICHLLSLHVVRSFGNIATCPWSRSLSCSSLAGLLLQHGLTTTHGGLVATECDISMLSLKLVFPACSQCQLPLSSITPTVPLI